MKRAFVLIMMVFFCAAAFAEVDISALKAANYTSRDLNSLFVKGMSRESIRSYDDALYAYNVILSRVQAMVNSKKASNTTLSYAMPYAIAAAYRKGIVTHRAIEGSVVKLYNQLKMYEDVEKWINEVLTEISDINIERGLEIPEEQYGMLYFARGYNRMGWAYALFNGNYWKRYLIYTPADTILMVDRSMDDLEKMYSIYENSYKDGSLLSSIGRPAEAKGPRVEVDDRSKYELITYSLCYNTDDVSRIQVLMGRQIENSVKASIDLYGSKGISSDLDKGRRIFAFEDMMDPKSRDVVVAMGRILREMGTN